MDRTHALLDAGLDPCLYTNRLLEILLPDGGMTLMMEAYFDESGTHQGSPVMCVAGYLFDSDQCKRLTEDWSQTLRSNGLAYFRMSECANGTGEFKNLPMAQRIEVERKLINHIKTRMTHGFAVSMVEQELVEMAPPGFIQVFGSAYTACTMIALASVGYWATERAYKGYIAYFFESGHADMGEAAKRLFMVKGIKSHREQYRYGSHTFADKKAVPALQAADLLAWQWRKLFISQTDPKRRLPRADLTVLVNNSPHVVRHFTGDLLERLLRSTIADFFKRWGESLVS